uniref:Uncharacterized protein n=1 Tax=Arundo donax TaxID=35708 RepID=A0A0A8Z0C5_ARUDO
MEDHKIQCLQAHEWFIQDKFTITAPPTIGKDLKKFTSPT